MKIKNLMIYSSCILSLVACGGGGGGDGNPDATSRKNALGASVSGSGSAASEGRNGRRNALASANLLFSTSQNVVLKADSEDDEDDMENESSESSQTENKFSESCEKGGKVSGTFEMAQDENGSDALVINAKFDKCSAVDFGNISGDLQITLASDSFDSEALQMTLDGKLNAKGKNAEGKLAPHSIEFQNVGFTLNPAMEDGGLASIPSCTGNIVIDGDSKSCQQHLNEAQNTESSEQQSSSRFYTTSDSGNKLAAYIFEPTGDIENFSVSLIVEGEEVHLPDDEGSYLSFNEVSRTDLSNFLNISNSEELNAFSDHAAIVILKGETMNQASAVIFKITYNGSSEITVQKDL